MKWVATQHPDLFLTNVVGFSFSESLLFVYEPKALKQILTDNRFSTPSNQVLKFFLGDNSLTTLEGEQHNRHRKMILPAFHKSQVQSYGNQICEISDRIFGQLPKNKPVNVFHLTKEIVLQTMLQVVFGFEGEKYQKLKTLSQNVIGLFDSGLSAIPLLNPWFQFDLGPWSPWGKFSRRKKALDDFTYSEIRERRAAESKDDLFSMLMSTVDEDGQAMDDVELRDELMNSMLGGVETTTIALSWAFYWILSLPQVRDRLLQELASSDCTDAVKTSQLPCLNAVCNETLRMYPPFPLTLQRRAEKPVELLGHQVEAGTDIVGCIYLLHQREDLYPQPEKFKPERFLGRQFAAFEFMPFGAGERRCTGAALATYIIKLALATVLPRYNLKLVLNRPVRTVRRNLMIAPDRFKLIRV